MKIILVGSGELGKEIKKYFIENDILVFDLFQDEILKGGIDYIIYAGSERLIEKTIEISKKINTEIILLSTNISRDKFLDSKVSVFENTSLEVLSFIESILFFAKNKVFDSIEITESHQYSKKDVSATALKICKLLNVDILNINSIRNPDEQTKIGIPFHFLSGHAYHKVIFENVGVFTSFEVLVLGRKTYAAGLLNILQNLKK